MYIYSEVVELGRAQRAIMGDKGFPPSEDAHPLGSFPADEFDE